MTDLTERLRIYAGQNYDSSVSFDAPELCHEAADEIEWLRATLISSVGQGVSEILAERDALRARIEGAVKVENFRRYSYGHEYLDISGTDEAEVTDGNLYGKRVALVVIE